MIIREAINTKAIDLSKVLPKYRVRDITKTWHTGAVLQFSHISYIDLIYFDWEVSLWHDGEQYVLWGKM